jgi:hypothetical protein
MNLQIDTDVVVPFYAFLAKAFSFSDHHFGAGSDSTSGHCLAVCGQTPTLKNPKFVDPPTVMWDVPTIFKLAERSAVTWGAFMDTTNNYPVHFFTEVSDQASRRLWLDSTTFPAVAAQGKLPQVCYVWAPGGKTEHPPPKDKPNPSYVSDGQDFVWQSVDAVVQAGEWLNTVFILTWDDWGGYADSVKTPTIEIVPDVLDARGNQVIGGSRLPLIMFGGMVVQGVEPNWHSHASLIKTVMDLFGLPEFGVPRVDKAPSLAGRVDSGLQRDEPPRYGTPVIQPAAPVPTPLPVAPAPWPPDELDQPMPTLVANHGGTLPIPSDGGVTVKPPRP